MCLVTVGGVVLAAGFSRRLGRPKQEVVLDGESLLQRAVRIAFTAGLAPVFAVVRELAGADRLRSLRAEIVVNAEAEQGMASSVRAGVSAAEHAGCGGVVLLTCDQPLLRPEHLRALVADGTRIIGSAYAGRVGVPAFFPTAVFSELKGLVGDRGARDLLVGAAVITDEALALDIDTDEDLQRAQKIFRERAFC